MATNDNDFHAADLIGPDGVGSNGEQLVASLKNFYPEDLHAAFLRNENEVLADKLDGKAMERIAKIAGVDRVEAATVRGGDRNEDDAWVTYVYFDERGSSQKGAFPYAGLKGTSTSVDGHVTQRDALNESPEAVAHRHAAAKADAAAKASSSSGDPIGDYEEMRDNEVVEYLEQHPERADVVIALETATRGDDARKSVLEAAKKAKGDDDPKGPPNTGGGTPPAGGSQGGSGGTQNS